MNKNGLVLVILSLNCLCCPVINAQQPDDAPEKESPPLDVTVNQEDSAAEHHDVVEVKELSETAAQAQDSFPDSNGKQDASEPGGNTVVPASTWRYEAGLRSLYMDLAKSKQGEPFNGSFIGSINELKPDQQLLPVHPYIQALKPIDHYLLGAGLSFDSWTVATEDGGGGDGDVEMDAWTIYLVGRMTTTSKFSPFAELGWAMYNNSFDPDPTWYAGGRRNFTFDNANGLHLAAGCDYMITPNLSANVYLRYVDVELDGKYIFRGDSRPPESFVFPMEHLAYGLGLSYTF